MSGREFEKSTFLLEKVFSVRWETTERESLPTLGEEILPEPMRLQGRGFQKGGGLCLVLGYRVCDVAK
jgi:hypothetical protein